jgi:hypothetical protein
LFGLLDADGWSWASLKAAFWFILIILLLGYIPDRAYYFTVFSTIDVGLNAISPINLCPPENRNLPCPAPNGAAVPWDLSPSELALPAPRTNGVAVISGTKIFYIGGTDGTNASNSVYLSDAFTAGNFSPWTTGPILPAARSRAAAAFLSGSIYVAGGSDASGQPTTTVWIETPNPTTGQLTAWQPGPDLPEARAGAQLAAISDGLVLIGGAGPDGKPTNTVWKSTLNATTNTLGPWTPNPPMVLGDGSPALRADGTAAVSGSWIFVYGGRDANGPTTVVMRGDIGIQGSTPGASASPSPAATGAPTPPSVITAWAQSTAASTMPQPRTDAAGFSANGALYLVGGSDGKTPQSEMYWTVPDSSGIIPQWLHLTASDLPAGGLMGSTAVVSGADVYLIGGQTSAGVTTSSLRAGLAPQPPFFQLGLVGAVIPALKIEGETGQQLGYLAAAGAGTVNFILLLLIGWAYAHKERTREIWYHLRHRGRKATP